jgi:hypothetical protein
MGMMTRRNARARAAQTARPVEVRTETRPAAVSLEDKVRNSGLKRTEIMRMTTSELQELAADFGVKNATEMSGNQIKKMLSAAYED